MLKTLPIALLLIFSNCSKEQPAAKDTSDPSATTALSNEPVTSPKKAGVDKAAMPADHVDLLIKLDAVKLIPKNATQSKDPGYPNSKTLVGAFTDEKSFRAVADAAKDAKLAALKPDWEHQMIVYTVFTGQTNSLGFKSFDKGTMSIEWSGIEPYYADSTPAVFAIVAKDGLKNLNFVTTDGRKLGTFSL